MEHRFFDFDAADPGERYRLMANAVTPRPVAFVTTVSPDGRANAARPAGDECCFRHVVLRSVSSLGKIITLVRNSAQHYCALILPRGH